MATRSLLLLRCRAVLRDFDRFNRDQAAGHHSIDDGKKSVDLLFSIYDLNQNRKVLGKPQDLSRMQTAGMAKPHGAAQYGSARDLHLAGLENDRFVKGLVMPAVAFAHEDSQRERIF